MKRVSITATPIALMTVWLICAAANPMDESITWNENWATGCDFPGNDLRHLNAPKEQCADRCASTPGCTHFTWTQLNGGTCFMKQGIVTKSDAISTGDDSMICGLRNRPKFGGSSNLPTIRWNDSWALGCLFRGDDFQHELIPREQCADRCANTPGCTHYTWTQHNGGTCWMKHGLVSKSDAVFTGDNSMMCGVNQQGPSGGHSSPTIKWSGSWALGCRFRGNDFQQELIPREQCADRCARTQSCTHYTWTQHNGGTCWMKLGFVSKSDAIATGDMSMMCGLTNLWGNSLYK